MSNNVFIEARDKLPSAVSTLPRELLQTNAVPLMAIVEELGASAMIEIGVIQAVTAVDIDDPSAITTQRTILEDYQQRRLFDRDRTHCSNINRIATQLRAPHQEQAASAKLIELDQLLGPLRNADDHLLDEVEQILGRAVKAIQRMDTPGLSLSEVRTEQDSFRNAMQRKVDSIHASLRELHALRGKLIDFMIGTPSA